MKKSAVKGRTTRPWGAYTVIKVGKGYKVKLVEVSPGKRLSLQRHKYRSEHWTVVSGIGRITRGDKTFILKHDQGTFIPKNTLHRLENTQRTTKLRVIEVQCGDYTGEDDIQRFDDDFGRISAGARSKKK